MGSLDGKVALIAGASSGIGEATADLMAAEGAKLALVARRDDRLGAARGGRVEWEGGEALPLEPDVTDHGKVEAVGRRRSSGSVRWTELPDQQRRGDAAGTGRGSRRRGVAADDRVNLLGLLYCTREAHADNARLGRGHIINVASVAGRTANLGTRVYNMTKWGVVGFSEALRQEALHSGIRVTCVEPGSSTPNFRATTRTRCGRGGGEVAQGHRRGAGGGRHRARDPLRGQRGRPRQHQRDHDSPPASAGRGTDERGALRWIGLTGVACFALIIAASLVSPPLWEAPGTTASAQESLDSLGGGSRADHRRPSSSTASPWASFSASPPGCGYGSARRSAPRLHSRRSSPSAGSPRRR